MKLTLPPECNSLEFTNSECNEYTFVAGFEIVRFNTEKQIIDFTSNESINLLVCAQAVATKYF